MALFKKSTKKLPADAEPSKTVQHANEPSKQTSARFLDKTSVIHQPLVTEKSMRLSALRQYVFLVNTHAKKPEIKKQIQALYNVTITGVHVVPAKTKPVFFRGVWSKRHQFKKAIVTVAEGQKIDIATNR